MASVRLMLMLMLKLLAHMLLDMLDTHTQLDMLDTLMVLDIPLLLLEVAETTLELPFLANCP